MKIVHSSAVHFMSPSHAHKETSLFRVNAGVDISAALHVSAELLESVMDLITEAAVGDTPLQGRSAVMVSHTLESARAAIDSVLGSMEKWNKLTPEG